MDKNLRKRPTILSHVNPLFYIFIWIFLNFLFSTYLFVCVCLHGQNKLIFRGSDIQTFNDYKFVKKRQKITSETLIRQYLGSITVDKLTKEFSEGTSTANNLYLLPVWWSQWCCLEQGSWMDQTRLAHPQPATFKIIINSKLVLYFLFVFVS